MIDLTHRLTPDIPRFPGDPDVRIEPLPGFAPWQVSALTMGTHSGTHMDAPRHRFPDAASIDRYGPDRLVGRGYVIDAPDLADNAAIPAAVLSSLGTHPAPGWLAVLRTGWDRFWGDERYFRHPFLAPELAQTLVALGAGLVAIDTLSVDSTVDRGSVAHEILLGADVLIAENLVSLGS
ncbi:MAG TPA: cyclase family protein, partial [Thermomicrobiales bacterium]|nr:cyclase family protein [Thermomicrobiales bacterium]